MEVLGAIIGWIIAGAVIGGIARLLMPGEQNLGCLMTIVLGIIGSFVGGFIASLVMDQEIRIDQPAGWIMSIIGAIILLAIGEFFARRSTPVD